jgi:hypothetical protein
VKKLLEGELPHKCPECGGKLTISKYVDEGRAMIAIAMIKVECDTCHNFMVGSEEAFLKS